jgi:hypothetical protein
MKEKIDKLKSSMKSQERDHPEVVDALERLGETVGDRDDYPGKDLIGDEIEQSALDLNNDDLLDGYLSGRWKSLGERLEEWECDHPGVTLVIGDIARALAVYGL